MILTQESPISGQLLTLLKPVGKEIPFRLGEIIEGQVADIFPSGGLTIKVKGGYLPVRSDLTFEKNETLFLKILGQGKKDGELVLQLINTKIRSGGEDQRTNIGVARMDDPARKASELILKLLDPRVESGKAAIGQLRPALEELLKSLPSNIQSLPKGLRTQLQQVLQSPTPGFIPDIRKKYYK